MKTKTPPSIIGLGLAAVIAAAILFPAGAQAGTPVKGAPKLLELQKHELEKIPALVEAEALEQANTAAMGCGKCPSAVINGMNTEKGRVR